MFNDKTLSRHGRQIYLQKKIRAITALSVIIAAIIASVFIIFRVKNGASNEKNELLRIWDEGNYEKVYEISKNALYKNPVDYNLLTLHGFSAYQLGISQINTQNTLLYIDESIFSLKKAMLHKEASGDGRIYYVLGKAYGYKGTEYSDLAVKYLEIAGGIYDAKDIPEYLGLAYAACGDYRNSVAAFSRAFSPGKLPSDSLLLAIARSYIAMEEYGIASGYLKRCIEISPDSKSVVIARLLLAEILRMTDDYDGAEEQYLSILNGSGENAEVHYQLGELYNLKGDTTRARAEWRLAYRQDPAHTGTRARLNI
ncbi:MAG: tetratricopeptide repeat protein [Treponema sp.]|jgi:tetratricopeptide (TPR) repeat protein|nr:tetratricopeptide repeat protein [Treponema sp.]